MARSRTIGSSEKAKRKREHKCDKCAKEEAKVKEIQEEKDGKEADVKEPIDSDEAGTDADRRRSAGVSDRVTKLEQMLINAESSQRRHKGSPSGDGRDRSRPKEDRKHHRHRHRRSRSSSSSSSSSSRSTSSASSGASVKRAARRIRRARRLVEAQHFDAKQHARRQLRQDPGLRLFSWEADHDEPRCAPELLGRIFGSGRTVLDHAKSLVTERNLRHAHEADSLLLAAAAVDELARDGAPLVESGACELLCRRIMAFDKATENLTSLDELKRNRAAFEKEFHVHDVAPGFGQGVSIPAYEKAVNRKHSSRKRLEKAK